MREGLDYVFSAIDTVNEQSKDGPQIKKSLDTKLMGDGSEIDSLLFVNLVVAIEEAIMDDTDQVITLITEDTIALDDSPFDTVQRLGNYVDSLLRAGA